MGEETPTRVVGYHRAGSMQAKEAGKWEWGEMRQLRWVAGTWSDGRQDGESVRCLGYGLDGIYSANQVSRHAVFVSAPHRPYNPGRGPRAWPGQAGLVGLALAPSGLGKRDAGDEKK
jgi:hypothetical protein